MQVSQFSAGWILLIGGLVGFIAVLRAKSFSWKNMEFLTSEEDRKKEVPMTPLRRWLLIIICILIASYGAIQIERDRGWNPFSNGGRPPAPLTK